LGGLEMKDFKKIAAQILNEAQIGMTFEEIESSIESPKQTNMGDLAFPCFKLAKEFRKAPPQIAVEISEKLFKNESFEKIEPVSGYINFTISKKELAKETIETILELKDLYGSSDIGQNKKVIVEFSSTNIAKPFHIGHIRSTMIGNSLYKIYKFLGYDVVGINHLGDYGTQFGKLIVAYKLWGDKELVESNPIPELLKLYVKFHDLAGEKPQLEDEARLWFKKLEENDQEAYDLWKWFREVSLKEFDRVYSLLGVHFDSYAGESFYSDKMEAVTDEMTEKGILVEDNKALIVDLSSYDLPNALIKKSDGSSLYITRDLAAAFYRKNTYDFYKNIYVVGSQQSLHFRQWMKILDLMGHQWAKDCVHVEFGTISLEDGALKTRTGNVVFLEDVLNKAIEKTFEIINEKNPDLKDKKKVAKDIGIGAVVFQELSSNRIKDYVFSWEKTLSFEGETGPYVQYTHARCSSVLAKRSLDNSKVDFSLIGDIKSIELLRMLSKFPNIVLQSSIKYEPSLISRYLIDLSQEFNRFYHDNPIIIDDLSLSHSRLSLVTCTKQVINNGLKLIGLNPVEQM
jgi:arginyl-tRNA synthetase